MLETENLESEKKKFESGFRKAFHGMSDFEAFSNFTTYPDIKVYPISVYRKIESCMNT